MSDIERKVMRIIMNYRALRKRPPSIKELRVRTARSRNGIYEVLSSLANEGFIVWERAKPEVIEMVESEETIKRRKIGKGHWHHS